MRIICDATSIALINKNKNNMSISGYIVGIKDYSLDSPKEYLCEEAIKIIEIIKKANKKVIVNLARLFHENELVGLITIIKSLPLLDIDYIMYSDFGVYQILVDFGYQNKTMLYSPTYLTNTKDVLCYQKINGSVVISNQISSDELIEIVNHTAVNKVIMGFGIATIFYSRRPLLTNYFSYRSDHSNPQGKKYTIQEETRDCHYPIIEYANYTKILDCEHYYLLSEISFFQRETEIIISGMMISPSKYNMLIQIITSCINNTNLIMDKENIKNKIENLGIKITKGAYGKQLTLRKGDLDEE